MVWGDQGSDFGLQDRRTRGFFGELEGMLIEAINQALLKRGRQQQLSNKATDGLSGMVSEF